MKCTERSKGGADTDRADGNVTSSTWLHGRLTIGIDAPLIAAAAGEARKTATHTGTAGETGAGGRHSRGDSGPRRACGAADTTTRCIEFPTASVPHPCGATAKNTCCDA